VNPASRRGARFQTRALDVFRRLGVTCDAVVTERQGHAATLANELGHLYDAVFTLGGDGTVMEVLTSLAHSGKPVGVIPGGTGNLVARALRVPLSIPRAIEALVEGPSVTVDLGRFSDGRCFCFAAGVGIDATMVQATRGWAKRRLGILGYALVASRAALSVEAFDVEVEVDGMRHARRATLVLVSNFGSVLGDLIRVAPEVSPYDGMLDLSVYCPETIRDAVRIAWRIVRKDFRADPCMLFGRGRRIRVACGSERPFQADGDLLGMTPFEVTVDPRAATFLVPRSSGTAPSVLPNE
jgi:YegS/Rv2252/BmrU family lipid kinase